VVLQPGDDSGCARPAERNLHAAADIALGCVDVQIVEKPVERYVEGYLDIARRADRRCVRNRIRAVDNFVDNFPRGRLSRGKEKPANLTARDSSQKDHVYQMLEKTCSGAVENETGMTD
jgi:hypothetical protein